MVQSDAYRTFDGVTAMRRRQGSTACRPRAINAGMLSTGLRHFKFPLPLPAVQVLPSHGSHRTLM